MLGEGHGLGEGVRNRLKRERARLFLIRAYPIACDPK